MATRQEKYPETKTFHYYNANPKNRITGDCTFRAIALAIGKSWESVVREYTELMIQTGYYDSRPSFTTRFLNQFGWVKHSQPRHTDGTKFTVRELARSSKQTMIVTMAGHMTCIKDGKVWDIWDCGDKCVGNYWTKG